MNQHEAALVYGEKFYIRARTRRGLRRKVKRFYATIAQTVSLAGYDYSQHSHSPVPGPYDTKNHPGHRALEVAKQRARIKLDLCRDDTRLLAALDEADRRGWL